MAIRLMWLQRVTQNLGPINDIDEGNQSSRWIFEERDGSVFELDDEEMAEVRTLVETRRKRRRLANLADEIIAEELGDSAVIHQASNSDMSDSQISRPVVNHNTLGFANTTSGDTDTKNG